MSNPFESMPYAQDASASAQSRQELQAKLNGLGGLNGRKLSAEAKEKKLREACEGFESIFIQKMWQEMRNTVPKGGLLQGHEERFWQDMYDQELAKSMTSAGGIGLADMMFEQLSRNLVSATRSSVTQAAGSAFTPGAAPLISMQEEEAVEASGPTVKAAASIYDGEAPQTAEANLAEEPQGVSTANLFAQTAAANLQAAEALAKQAAIDAASKAASKVSYAEKTKTVKAHVPGESSGLQLAYMAKRDAGDKLSANAIRPPIHPSRPSARKTEENPTASAQAYDPTTIRQNGNLNPGSAEGIKAALQNARSGASSINTEQPQQLHNIVAAVQAQNSMNVAHTSAAGNPVTVADNVQAQAAEPTITKLRYTTNIPQKGKNSKSPKKNEVIRMLNVENTGVNSKAGQGLAAYHAAQEASKAENTAKPVQSTATSAAETQPIAPISPLTAQSLKADNEANNGNFAIPPLKASGAHS